jgi:hypothetical protein
LIVSPLIAAATASRSTAYLTPVLARRNGVAGFEALTDTLFGFPTRVRLGEMVKSTVPVVADAQVIVILLVVLPEVIVVEDEDGVPLVLQVMV